MELGIFSAPNALKLLHVRQWLTLLPPRLAKMAFYVSSEALAHELGVSFSTINRWENAKTVPFKLARKQFDAFCEKLEKQQKLKLLPKGEE